MNNIKERKARKQKRIAVVGGVILIGLLAFTGPRTLKMLHGGSSQSSTPYRAVQPADVTPSAAPAVPVASAATSLAVNSDPPPVSTKSQLVSFDQFHSKDPFVQQVTDEPAADATAAPGPSTSAAPTAAASTGSTAAPTSAGTTASSGTPSSSSSTSAAAATTASGRSPRLLAAVVEVNGERQSVGVMQTFPKANPTFKLISLDNSVAKIGIAGGTYASGAPTVALRLGRSLTLVNTADGMRYELRLVSAR